MEESMAKILLSIKPEYVAKIFDHTKKYEFRKRIPQRPIDKIVVYSSNPEQHIVGEFEVLETIKMKPSPLWDTTKRAAGITRAKYRKYFHGCETAYAFKIGNPVLYETPKELNDYGISTPPQSFTYLSDT